MYKIITKLLSLQSNFKYFGIFVTPSGHVYVKYTNGQEYTAPPLL